LGYNGSGHGTRTQTQTATSQIQIGDKTEGKRAHNKNKIERNIQLRKVQLGMLFEKNRRLNEQKPTRHSCYSKVNFSSWRQLQQGPQKTWTPQKRERGKGTNRKLNCELQ